MYNKALFWSLMFFNIESKTKYNHGYWFKSGELDISMDISDLAYGIYQVSENS